jgi:hypothetical protein
MSIIAQSPLEDLYVGESIAIPLGDSSPGFVWDVPPGSILPPGLKLNSEFGVLFGVPTINHFIVEVKAIRTSDSPTIESLIAKALTLNQRVAGQTIYFTQSLDAQNRKVYALQFIDSGGQVRTLASIAIP